MKKETKTQESGKYVQKNETSTKKKAVSKKEAAETAESADAKTDEDESPAPAMEAAAQPAKEEEAKTKSDPICIVIPYLAEKAKGDELRYAVRAWEKSMPGIRIVIIGDKPAWAGKDLEHIPHKPQSKNPQVDVAHKMMAAIASDLVPNVFVWTNDDIYTLCPVELADIITLKSHGLLANRGKANGVYQENAKRTLEALKKQGIAAPYDYATHTPVIVEKQGLSKIIEDFECDKEGQLVYTLYANMFFRDHRPIITQNDGRGSIIASVYRPNPDPRILDKVLASRKWINNNDSGWKVLEPKLKELFPEKCRFEK
ncbi:hypothetical protein [Cyclobacterium sp.]|uniref:hypothetical protein n=1 Tax=Cyclobacterium sp. TaxID=1966343 RepID=UPI0019B73F12|nr:hypothetical protein [Cyclobacterium sp.]MBD3630508.1 hypothetical protein [Cyclobacterium sp.]